MSRLFLFLARMLHQRTATTEHQLVAEDVNRHQDSSCLNLFPFGTSAIEKLPTEVLHIIFTDLPAVTYVFHAGVGFRPGKKEGSPKLGTPAHVCRRWRTIMGSVPFVLRLVIGNGGDASTAALHPLMGNLECLLKEWDRAPFDLRLEAWGMPVPRNHHRSVSPAPLRPILGLLFERSAQWRSITIDRVPCMDNLLPLLGEPLRLPRLEHVHLDFGDDVGAVNAFAAAPRLSAAYVALYSHDMILPKLPWNQLTHLTVKMYSMPIDMDPIQLPPCICRVLRLSTQLTHLRILSDFYGALIQRQHSGRVGYMIPSSIRHLTVGRATLDVLASPSVTTLQVIPSSSMSLVPVLSFIRRSRCDALSRLVFHGVLAEGSGHHLRDLLHETQQLSELELMFSPVPGTLHYEILDIIDPFYSPSLTTLVLRTSRNFDLPLHSRRIKVDLDDSFHDLGSDRVQVHDFIESILMDVFVFIERRRQAAIRSRGTCRLRSIQVNAGIRLSGLDSHTLDVSDTEVFRSLKDLAGHPCTPKLRLVVHVSCGSSRLCNTYCSVKHAACSCEAVKYDILQ